MREFWVLGLTSVGILHATSSLIALLSGMSAILRSRGIRFEDHFGRMYVAATFVACLSGLAKFGLNGFGKPDFVGCLTIAALGFAVWPVGSTVLGPGWRYAVIISYSTLLFFYSLSVDAPVEYVLDVTFGIYSAGLIWEVWHRRRNLWRASHPHRISTARQRLSARAAPCVHRDFQIPGRRSSPPSNSPERPWV